jgi:hypothetical protein
MIATPDQGRKRGVRRFFPLVGNMRGPGDEDDSRGPGKPVYAFDPSEHLIEIRHYEV